MTYVGLYSSFWAWEWVVGGRWRGRRPMWWCALHAGRCMDRNYRALQLLVAHACKNTIGKWYNHAILAIASRKSEHSKISSLSMQCSVC
eukprot:scaffold9_cov98-Skeletonema_marinoi.AAC.2